MPLLGCRIHLGLGKFNYFHCLRGVGRKYTHKTHTEEIAGHQKKKEKKKREFYQKKRKERRRHGC